MLDVERTERAGIPVVFADLPGPCRGGLVFRVGIADETFPRRGITNFAARLACAELDHGGVWVDLTETDVTFEGEPDEVADDLAAVARALAAPPFGRLEEVRRRLELEETYVPDIDFVRAYQRYGVAGYGLAGIEENGVPWLGPAELATWAAERFVAGNAAIWMTQPPPDALDVLLPGGPRRPPPAPHAIPTLSFPLERIHNAEDVALASELPATRAAEALYVVLMLRAQSRLDDELALVSDLDADCVALDGRYAHGVMKAACRRRDAARVRDELVRLLDGIATDGASEEEVERYRDAVRETLAGDEAGLVRSAVTGELRGTLPDFGPEALAARDEVGCDDVAAAAQEALATLLVDVPAGTLPSGRRFTPFRSERTDPVVGVVHEPNERWRKAEPLALTVGAAGASATDRHGTITMLFAECVAAAPTPSGMLTVRDASDAWLRLNPWSMDGGADVVRDVLAAVPPAAVQRLPAREQEIAAVAAEQLGDDLGRVPYAVDVLADVLADGETIACLAATERHDAAWLLAVTDDRVMWLSGSDIEVDIESHALADVRVAAAGTRLRFDADGETSVLPYVAPARQLARLVDLLGARP